MGIGFYGSKRMDASAPGTPVAEDTKSIADRLKEIQAEKARERAIEAEKEAIQVEDYYGC